MSDLPECILERVFDAPRNLVWRAWTDPELLNQWYGPGVETVIHEFNLTPGGFWLNEMKFGANSSFQKVIFCEVEAETRLVWDHCSADADWNVAKSPMMPDWPMKLDTNVTFVAQGDKTLVTLSQTPMDATEAEAACCGKMMSGMDSGWGSGYVIIDKLLAELQV
jgi:uncharacterized protein YndB with AHSA1/START domain